MGYFSDLRIALTKRDYLTMLEKDRKNSNLCKFILDENQAYIKQYTENDVECVLLQQFDSKYYEDFKEVQQFEKYLREAKSGYLFMRIGSRWNDIEYRNTSKLKELEVPFEFIKTIKEDINREKLIREKGYKNMSKQHIFTDKKDILEFYEDNEKLNKYISEKCEKSYQFKLLLNVDSTKKEALAILYERQPEENEYREFKSEYADMDGALWYLGYTDIEDFLQDINDSIVDEIEEEME